MNANPILLQKKYARVVELLQRKMQLLSQSIGYFYHSQLYELMSNGVSDMHCMSDEYLVHELINEQKEVNG